MNDPTPRDEQPLTLKQQLPYPYDQDLSDVLRGLCLRWRVMHRVLGYAVRKKRLDKNPLSKNNLPEGWTAPEKPEEQVDPRSVGSPADPGKDDESR